MDCYNYIATYGKTVLLFIAPICSLAIMYCKRVATIEKSLHAKMGKLLMLSYAAGYTTRSFELIKHVLLCIATPVASQLQVG